MYFVLRRWFVVLLIFLGYEVEEVMSASNQVNCGRSMCVGASFTDMYYVCVCECVCILYVCGCA